MENIAMQYEERIRFALMRSRVFDNAYFVNNYGWFQGSAITANGDVRANGNLYLDSGCTVARDDRSRGMSVMRILRSGTPGPRAARAPARESPG